MPHSAEKVQRKKIMQYQKLFFQKIKEVQVNEEKLKKLREMHQIITNNKMNENQAKNQHRELQNSQKELKEKEKESKGRELLDYSKPSIEQGNKNDAKQRKRIMKGISESMKRQHFFRHVAKHVGRGFRSCLKRVCQVSKENKIASTKQEKRRQKSQ